MINDTPKKNLNKYFTEDYFDKTFGSDPNKKITFKEMLEKLTIDEEYIIVESED